MVLRNFPFLTEGKEIPNSGKYMLDHGFVYELNRVFFHPLGLALVARQNLEEDRTELVLFNRPNATLDPQTFLNGRRKWQRWLQIWGRKRYLQRRRTVGLKQPQRMPDYREQVKLGG